MQTLFILDLCLFILSIRQKNARSSFVWRRHSVSVTSCSVRFFSVVLWNFKTRPAFTFFLVLGKSNVDVLSIVLFLLYVCLIHFSLAFLSRLSSRRWFCILDSLFCEMFAFPEENKRRQTKSTSRGQPTFQSGRCFNVTIFFNGSIWILWEIGLNFVCLLLACIGLMDVFSYGNVKNDSNVGRIVWAEISIISDWFGLLATLALIISSIWRRKFYPKIVSPKWFLVSFQPNCEKGLIIIDTFG